MVVGTVVLDGIQYAEETVDNLVRNTYSCISTRSVSGSNLVALTAGFTARLMGLLYKWESFMRMKIEFDYGFI